MKIRQRLEEDYTPIHTTTGGATIQDRIADALEYIAFQLGQINRKLDKLTKD
jgi:hypothetical protein